MSKTLIINSLFYSSIKTIPQVSIELGVDGNTISGIWDNYSDIEKKHRNTLIKKGIMLDDVVQWFYTDKSTRVLSTEFKVQRRLIADIWNLKFSKDLLKTRKNKMDSLSKIGEKNHMFGKSGTSSPVYGRKADADELIKRSKAMMGVAKGRISKRRGVVLSEETKSKKKHSEAMSVRQRPSVSNMESGAGVKKGQAIQFAINSANPELVEHERKRKELNMTKVDYMKHIGVDDQFLRRLSRGYESKSKKPTSFNVDHPNAEYANHERTRQELNMTQDAYLEFIGKDKTFLRRLKNKNLKHAEKIKVHHNRNNKHKNKA
jgi:predicted XRE-type DNA-binding protein